MSGRLVSFPKRLGLVTSGGRTSLRGRQLFWGLTLAVPVSAGVFLMTPSIIALFGTEPNVAAAATTYMQITAATRVALFLSFVCGAVLRGAGDSRTPLAAAVRPTSSTSPSRTR